MSPQHSRVRNYVEDIRDTSAHVLDFTRHVTEEQFCENIMLQYSVVRGIEVLGEASKQMMELSPQAVSRFPSLPLRRMNATRNRVIHGYLTLDLTIIWQIATEEIPRVHAAAKHILDNWPADLS